MALQFQPYEKPKKSKREALLEPIGQTIQQLPSLIMQMEQIKRQRELQDLEHKKTRSSLQLELAKLQREQSYMDPTTQQVRTVPGVNPSAYVGEDLSISGLTGAPPAQAAPIGLSAAGKNKETARTFQFVGMDQNGNPISFDTKSNTFHVGKLPEGGMMPKPGRVPSSELDQLNKFDELGTVINQVEDSRSDALIGPIASKVGWAKQKTGVGATEQAGKFYGSINDLMNQLIYLRSGKQINENEFVRLKAAMPDPSTSPTDFNAKWENFKQIFETIKASKLKYLGASNYALKGGILPGPQTPSAPQGQTSVSNPALPQVGSQFQGGKVLSIKRIE